MTRRGKFDDFVITLFTAWKPTVRLAAKAVFSRRATSALDRSVGRALDQRPSQIGLDAWIVAFETLLDLDDPEVWSAIDGASQKLEREQAGLDKRTRTNVAVRRKR